LYWAELGDVFRLLAQWHAERKRARIRRERNERRGRLWHEPLGRRYILKFERALIAADMELRPAEATPVCLPYWHWIPFPEWLDGFLPANRPDNYTPPSARRKKSPPEKPNQADEDYIINGFASQMPGVNTDDYTRFTYGLEGWGKR
jgi:tyrosinase